MIASIQSTLDKEREENDGIKNKLSMCILQITQLDKNNKELFKERN